jgi:hypothetical protein
MPGWQVTLIAIGAALAAAITAVRLDRARTRRRLAHPATRPTERTVGRPGSFMAQRPEAPEDHDLRLEHRLQRTGMAPDLRIKRRARSVSKPSEPVRRLR